VPGFQGEKIFYILPPTERNLSAFTKHQQEDVADGIKFFADNEFLTERCVRVVVGEVR